MNYTLPQLLKTLVDQGASDLHVSAHSPPRLRIDGALIPLQLPPLSPEESQQLCYSVLTESQRRDFETTKELDLAFSVGKLARFRANIFLQKGAVGGAFRVIPSLIKTIEELGMPGVIAELCATPKGLVLVTGPTGSGKSTTLASMINHINLTRFDHIITIEDPIEFIHDHKNCIVNQRELGDDTVSFGKALRSALRQDPDVIMVGELRDLDTISAALTAAETGHLVFGTLHTNSAVSTLNRIIDVFPPHQQLQIRTQLSMTLVAVISQQLIPAIRGGRVLGLELMRNTKAIAALINEGKFNQIYSAMQTGQEDTSMTTMNQSLLRHYQRRVIDRKEALQKSMDPDELAELIDSHRSHPHGPSARRKSS